MKYRIISNKEEDTIELAENIESEKFKNMVICLEGDLGVGKTLFTKGFAHALGVKENVTSPTFTIIKEYESGELPLYHMDAYRLDGDPFEIGLEDYFKKDGIVVIEWAETIKEYLPEERLEIKLVASETKEDRRIITIIPHGSKYEDLCERVL